MRTPYLTIASVAFALFAFTACGGGEAPAARTNATEQNGSEQATEAGVHEHHDHAHYQCPMKCEGDKTYEEPGTCPVCKMDLAEVNE